MDNSKALLYNGKEIEGDVMPKVKYDDIPEERKKKWRKHMHTFDGVVKNDDEFEEWLAVKLHFSGGGVAMGVEDGKPVVKELSPEEDAKMLRDQAEWHRHEYKHIKDFKAWRVKNLDPEIKKLASMAEHQPQYDWQEIYALERQKLLCMCTYFSHSRIADENGNFDGRMWLDICLSLLDDIQNGGMNLPFSRIKKVNVRNVNDIVDSRTIDKYLDACKRHKNYSEDRKYYGRDIYVRKMERLYHLIRLYKTRDWWE